MKAGPTLILSTLLGLSHALQLTDKSWSPCEGQRAVNIVDISPCDAEPCVLAQGKKYTVSMSGENGESAVNDVHLNIDGNFAGWVRFANKLVCGSSLTCPVEPLGKWTLDYTWAVDDSLPLGQSQETKWLLVGNNGASELGCADIIVTIA